MEPTTTELISTLFRPSMYQTTVDLTEWSRCGLTCPQGDSYLRIERKGTGL
jgi:hypothetical protein